MKLVRITPCLWFNDAAEAAVAQYVRVFPDSRIARTLRYDAGAARQAGLPVVSVHSIEVELDGQPGTALKGGRLACGRDRPPAGRCRSGGSVA